MHCGGPGLYVFSQCPTINGLFPTGRRPPRVYDCGLRTVRLAESPVAGCGLAQRNKSTFMNWTINSVIKYSWMAQVSPSTVLLFALISVGVVHLLSNLL